MCSILTPVPNAMYIKWNIENQFENRKPIIFRDIFRVWTGTISPKDESVSSIYTYQV